MLNRSVRAAIFFALVGVTTATGLAVAIAVGSIPDDDGTIHVCYREHKNAKEGQGSVRVVSSADKCNKNEVYLIPNPPKDGLGDSP